MNASFVEGACRVIECQDVLVMKFRTAVLEEVVRGGVREGEQTALAAYEQGICTSHRMRPELETSMQLGL
jgi:hypothetical protein